MEGPRSCPDLENNSAAWKPASNLDVLGAINTSSLCFLVHYVCALTYRSLRVKDVSVSDSRAKFISFMSFYKHDTSRMLTASLYRIEAISLCAK